MTLKRCLQLLLGISPGLFLLSGVAGPAVRELRGAGLLTPIATSLSALGSLGLWRLLRRSSFSREACPPGSIALALLGVGLLTSFWELPEERLHVVTFFLLGVVMTRRLEAPWTTILCLGLGVGVLDELLQWFHPHRVFDLRDIASNAIGVIAGVLLARGGRSSWLSPLLIAVLLSAFLLHGAPFALPQSSTPQAGVSTDNPIGPFAQFEDQGGSARPGSEAESPATGSAADTQSKTSVLLVSFDALRLDVVPPWGGGEVPTPNFDRLAAESYTFSEGRANALWTSPGVVSLLTGLHPGVHGVEVRGQELPLGPSYPLGQLHEAGFSSLGFAGSETENYRNLGFRQEMDREQPLSAQVVGALQEPGPSFTWLHLRDIHAPYDASPEELRALGLPSALPDSPIMTRLRGRPTVPRSQFPGDHSWLRPSLRNLYLAELHRADRSLGSLLAQLDEAGVLDEIILVVTADHGEELLEYGGVGHASTNLDAGVQAPIVEIPIYVRLPDSAGSLNSARRRIAHHFEQVDLMPTVFGLLGLELKSPIEGLSVDGVDLSPLLRNPGAVMPERAPTLVSSSPCGWQCPEERKDERVHALVASEGWTWCRPPQAPCESTLGEQARAAASRRARLRSVSAGGPGEREGTFERAGSPTAE